MITFRQWGIRYRDGRPVLRSLSTGMLWERPELTAHASPVSGPYAGIHSITDWAARSSWIEIPNRQCWDVTAVGAIESSGAVVMHEHGEVRAERARVLALRLVPWLERPCPHDGVYLDVTSPESRREGSVMFCPCSTSWGLVERERVASFETFERMLLDVYGVPRLPDDVGPWWPPFGAGPKPMPEA